MCSVQDFKCVSHGMIMYNFQNNKVCELISSVFCSSLCLVKGNNYTIGVMSLGRLWNILYEKEPLKLCVTELRKKAVVFPCQNLIMKCYVTILVEIYGDPIFFWIRSGFCQSDAIRSRFCQSGPIRSDPIRSDPIRSWFC